MKLLTKLLVAACIVCASTLISNAQEEEQKSQMFMIHVDHVISSKSMQYEEANKGFNALCSEHGLTDANTWTFALSNGDYMHVSMLESMANLDKNPFSAVVEKAGKDAWATMYSKFDGTYMEHESFIVNGNPEVSYKAEQLQQEGMNYRVWSYNYYEDKDTEEVKKISKKWKELYEAKNIETGYTIYSDGLGHPGPVIIVMRWAKSPAEYYTQMEKTWEALGEEGKKLGQETSKLIYKHEKVDGWFKPDLSYITTNPDGTVRND
jgi:hypothetical protein